MSDHLNIPEFIDYLKKHDLVIVPRDMMAGQLVNGVPLHNYRNGLLQKKLLSPKQIVDGRLWGDIKKPRVHQIIKTHLSPNQILRKGPLNAQFIPRHLVVNIAKLRGEVWPNNL